MDHRAFFDLGHSMTGRTVHDTRGLLDHQRDVGSSAFIANDADILQAHKRLEDLTRVDKDEGASCFLAHTTSLKRLRLILGDFGPSETPLRSEDPVFHWQSQRGSNPCLHLERVVS